MYPEVERSTVARFLDDIGRFPLMTPDEEIICARQVHKMMELQALERPLTRREQHTIKVGERARRRFVEANLRLVVFVAKKFPANRLNTLSLMDIVQEGSVGLLKAIERFDPERGYKFSTYAFWWIRQAIHRAIFQTDNTIRKPMGAAELGHKLAKVRHELLHELGRDPTLAELAERLKTSVAELELLLTRGARMTSLDGLCNPHDEGASALMDLIADPVSLEQDNEYALMREMHYAKVEAAMEKLTEGERTVIMARYHHDTMEPPTFADIARDMGVCRERVRQLLFKGTKKLRFHITVAEEPVAPPPPPPPPPAPRKARPLTRARLSGPWR